MIDEIRAENERLRAENERLRKWLERITGAPAEEVYETPGAIQYWADQALAGEPA